MELILKPIGYVESCYRDRFAIPRQPLLVDEAWAFIRFQPEIQPELSLEGLDGFSHLWVIFGFHLNQNSRFHAKVHPPRLGGQSMGLFATRTPHRPNPLGLSLVKVTGVSSQGLSISGGDLADGTPVYDVKPYIPEIEAVTPARGGWTEGMEITKIPVRFATPELSLKIVRWGESIGQPNILKLISQTLEHDPRPLVYRETKKNYKSDHAFRLFNGDIHFRYENECFLVFDFIV